MQNTEIIRTVYGLHKSLVGELEALGSSSGVGKSKKLGGLDLFLNQNSSVLELSVGKKAVIGDSKRLFLEKEAIVAKAVMPLLTTHAY